uniref:Uncharacterized protein n=1 Tax=Musca domestica TaxID=7370 RepID=A0A1I8MH34_MUSDO
MDTDLANMDKQITEKLEALMKYIPFIDYILEIDRGKYVKFVDIKRWIVNKKRYPLNDLKKIEQSIITQYKNLLVMDDRKVPAEIMNIFSKEFKAEFVNLCSDDEDEGEEAKDKKQQTCTVSKRQEKPNTSRTTDKETVVKPNTSRKTDKETAKKQNTTKKSDKESAKSPSEASKTKEISLESDDDLEIISVSYPTSTADKAKQPKNDVKGKTKEEAESSKAKNLDDVTKSLLDEIDNICDEDNFVKNVEKSPTICKKKMSNEDTRVSSKTSPANKQINKSEAPIVDTISLDDSSDDEEVNPNPIKETVKKVSQQQLGAEKPSPVLEEKPLFTRRSNVRKSIENNNQTDERNKTVPSPPTATNSVEEETKSSIDPTIISAINDISLKSLDNSNCEDLLTCIIKVSESKSTILENLLLKTIIKRLRANEEQKPKDVGAAPALSANIDNSHPNNENANANPTSVLPTNSNLPLHSTGGQQYYQPHFNPPAAATPYPQYNQVPSPSMIHQPIPHPNYESNAGPHAYPNSPQYAPAPPCQRRLNLNDPRIKNLINKFKASPLLTPQQKMMLTKFGQVPMPQIPSNIQAQPIQSMPPNVPLNKFNDPVSSATPQNTQPLQYPAPHLSRPNNTKSFELQKNPIKANTPKPAISMEEYKHRKEMERLQKLREDDEKKRQTEHQRKEEEKKRQEMDKRTFEDIEKRNSLKSTEEIRSILLSTLQPSEIDALRDSFKNARKNSSETESETNYGKQNSHKRVDKENAKSLLNEKKNNSKPNGHKKITDLDVSEKLTNGMESDKKSPTRRPSEDLKENVMDCHNTKEEHQKTTPTKKSSNANKSKKAKSSRSSSSSGGNRKVDITREMNRVYRELECTVKGFDQIMDYMPKAIGGKRRSSVHARSVISEQLNVDEESTTEISSSQTSSDSLISSFQLRKRRKTIDTHFEHQKRQSSMQAHNAIAHQLSSQEDNGEARADMLPERRKTTEGNFHNAMDVDGDDCEHRIGYSSSNDGETKPIIPLKVPKIILKRLTQKEIEKYTIVQKSTENNGDSALDTSILKVQLIPTSTKHVTPSTSGNRKPLPQILNNDCQMFEKNTRICVLCNSKSPDLTNHFVGKHKTESYVARLSWSQLDELLLNTPFATAVSGGKLSGALPQYSIKCQFCETQIKGIFHKFYDHYSSHTGEFAYQCGQCKYSRPYREFITIHQLNKKRCSNAKTQILYRYKADARVIYLYYCNICNFVQLNEANIFKHLREHHDARQATQDNVKKCILAAISDGPDSSNTIERQDSAETTPSEGVVPKIETKLELMDDNILVCNEPCMDEEEAATAAEENYDLATCALDEQLKQMHEDLQTPPTPPMTTIHFNSNPVQAISNRLKPLAIKPEPEPMNDDEDNRLTPPPSHPPRQYIDQSGISPPYRLSYRCYPMHVKYLGLFKCLTDDCYFSTDCPKEFQHHLQSHTDESLCLQCAYCSFQGQISSIETLIGHIQNDHSRMLFQCSECCYRSIDGCNVLVHQREKHCSGLDGNDSLKVFKCHGEEAAFCEETSREKLKMNAPKITCEYCRQYSYYNSNFLKHHMLNEHKIQKHSKYYSCLYCTFKANDDFVLRKHLALCHPNEFAYIRDHNSAEISQEDSVEQLHLLQLSEPITRLIDYSKANVIEDVKPNADELLKCQEETLKIRLRKLTEKTGIAPDCLYRCPEQSCGGFFSIYDLWLRHMRTKHCCLECACPHCPGEKLLPLEEFKTHFENHRRHLYLCYHCPLTFASNEEAMAHVSSTGHVNSYGAMRSERIRFNLSYSYFILLPLDKLKERAEFIPNILNLLDERLRELESRESKSYKNSWLIPTEDSPNWLEDFPTDICRKLKKKCFNGKCDFRAIEAAELFQHVREKHKISGSTFSCRQCDFSIVNCQHWDDILAHIHQHFDSTFFICGACSAYFYNRSKMATHIREKHDCRDVPLINLIKVKKQIYIRLAIVFASKCLSFSTMRNCFCCEEKGMKGDAYILHLKRYHKFSLQYFCEWCNLPIESLQLVKDHFSKVHRVNTLKIRCELASKYNIKVKSVSNFELDIDTREEVVLHLQQQPMVQIKPEPEEIMENDDSVVILDDDDIIVENHVKDQEKMEQEYKPMLKCIAMDSLREKTMPQHFSHAQMSTQNSNISSTTANVNGASHLTHLQMPPAINQPYNIPSSSHPHSVIPQNSNVPMSMAYGQANPPLHAVQLGSRNILHSVPPNSHANISNIQLMPNSIARIGSVTSNGVPHNIRQQHIVRMPANQPPTTAAATHPIQYYSNNNFPHQPTQQQVQYPRNNFVHAATTAANASNQYSNNHITYQTTHYNPTSLNSNPQYSSSTYTTSPSVTQMSTSTVNNSRPYHNYPPNHFQTNNYVQNTHLVNGHPTSFTATQQQQFNAGYHTSFT